jgi:hypothetical protein
VTVSSAASRLTLVLLHHPVVDRTGAVITSTIDHFDVMDGSRLALTYGLDGFVVVNPEPSQRALMERLLRHGADEAGRERERGTFTRTSWAPDLATVVADIVARTGRAPLVVTTSARPDGADIDFATLRASMSDAQVVLVLGKAWGLAPAAFAASDRRLVPIDAGTGFNHLSVRSAMAILVDRLCR